MILSWKSWAEIMLNSRRWAEIRARGRRAFVLRYGVVPGLIVGDLSAAFFLWDTSDVTDQTFTVLRLSVAIAFLIAGPAIQSLSMLAGWHISEAIYSRRKS